MRKIPRLVAAGAVLAASAVVTVVPLSGTLAGAVAPSCGSGGTPTVTALQSSNFYIDAAKDQLFAQFAGYTIGANGAARDGMWIQLGNFQGGVVSLGSSESGEQPIDQLASDGAQTRFFLLRATGETLTPQTHTISIVQGTPSRGGTVVCTSTFTYTRVADTISAKANKVTSVSADTTSEVRIGDLVTVTVSGNTGTLGAGPAYDPGALNYTPTALTSFPSGAWRLERTELTISPDGNAGQQTFVDQLHLESSASGPNRPYTARYSFRAVGPSTTSTPVVPIQYIASGTQIKHTTLTGLYPSLPPVSPIFNVTLAKTVDRPEIEVGESKIVNYTLVITNDEPVPVRLDNVVDTLPTGSTYTTDSLMVDGESVDPIDTDPLVVPGILTVAAGGTITITYEVDLGETTGSRVNSAIAEYGSVVIDASADTLESTPATATVLVLDPVPAVSVTKSAGEVVDVEGGVDGRADAGDTITYTYVVSNTGTADLHSISVVDDKIDDDATEIVCEGSSAPTNVIASIEWGGSDVTCTADYVITQADIDAGDVTNTVLVTALGPDNEEVTHEESVTKDLPADHNLEVDKSGELDITVITPDDRPDAGDVASYTYAITNSGNITETNVTLTDNKIADASLFCGTTETDTIDDNVIDALAPGETRLCAGDYALTQTDLDDGAVTNIALATSDDTEGEGFTTIELAADPELTVTKVADRETAQLAGEEITYTITVENTGNVTMSDVLVTDDRVAELTCTADEGVTGDNGTFVVAPGMMVTCTGSYTVTESDIVDETEIPNTATAEGYAPNDVNPYTFTGSTNVTVDPLLTDIAGRVWIDRNTSGTYNAGDLPLIGLTVHAELISARDGGVGAATLPEQVFTATTSSAGTYRFSNLRAGTYRITVPLETQFVYQIGDTDGGTDWVVIVDAPPAIAPASVSAQVNGGTARADFRAQGAGTIVGKVFDPTTGDPYPYANVTCRWAGPDGVMGNGDDTTLRTPADSLGGYRLNRLPFGEYLCSAITMDGNESLPSSPVVTNPTPVNAPLPLPTIPETGSNIGGILTLAGGLLLAGLVMLEIRRRPLALIRR